MNIGDKVRLLRDNLDGVITKFIDDKLIEIEIEDGFNIPVLRKEVVVVAREESSHFEETAQQPADKAKEVKSKIISQSGIFLAFPEINDQKLSVYLINNTDLDTPYQVGEMDRVNYRGLSAGMLRARSHVKITERTTTTFEKWPALIIQMLFHKHGIFTLKEPLQKKLNFKAATFFKSKRKAPLLDKEAYLFQIDAEVQKIDPEKLKEQFLKGETPEEKHQEAAIIGAPEAIVDLHIDQLLEDYTQMSNAEILNYQMDFFEKQLDAAIASGMKEITFIHGAGNGVLKNAIHKKLSKVSEIRFFQEAMKEKFGYGATLVTIQ